MKKFENLKQRLKNKILASATPVTGFILGLSGTDSIATYILLNEARKDLRGDSELPGDSPFGIWGMHYVEDINKPTPFQLDTLPWLQYEYPDCVTYIGTPHGGNEDQFRWAHMHHSAVDFGYWVASSVTATEKALGTYSIMAKSASIEPIGSLYKTEVLQVCEYYGVPAPAIQRSRLPDCLCGREEFAAENIELIDEVLKNNLSQDYSPALIRNAMDYIRDNKTRNGFKARTPYGV